METNTASGGVQPTGDSTALLAEYAGRWADTTGWTLDSAANVKARQPPERAPEPPSSGFH